MRNLLYGVKYGIKSNSVRWVKPTLYTTPCSYGRIDDINLKEFCRRIFNNTNVRCKTISEYYKKRESDECSYRIVNGDKYIMKRYMHYDEDWSTISIQATYDFSRLSKHKRGLL